MRNVRRSVVPLALERDEDGGIEPVFVAIGKGNRRRNPSDHELRERSLKAEHGFEAAFFQSISAQQVRKNSNSAVASTIQSGPPQSATYELDVADQHAWETVLEELRRLYGPVAALVNNAAVKVLMQAIAAGEEGAFLAPSTI